MPFDSANFEKPQVDEVGQIILKARDLLSDPAKWFKGDYVCQETGAVCILGALGVRDDRFDQSFEAVRPAIERIAAYLPFDFEASVFEFNDDPTTTHKMVLDLLDRAAKGA
jgi:hypothetical protein